MTLLIDTDSEDMTVYRLFVPKYYYTIYKYTDYSYDVWTTDSMGISYDGHFEARTFPTMDVLHDQSINQNADLYSAS